MTRIQLAGIAALALAALGACDRGRRPDYSEHPDSGGSASPPATRTDIRDSRQQPDSTAGVSERTERPQSAGDSSRQSKRPARVP
jgi:hypothetical protein